MPITNKSHKPIIINRSQKPIEAKSWQSQKPTEAKKPTEAQKTRKNPK